MAISYEDIINADLGDLETAAKSWETMGKRFGTLGGHYRDHVRAAVDADSWQGKAAHKFGQWGRKTAEEYDQAKGEAHGVAALLRLAHATLTAHKKAVEAVRDDAQDEGLDVDSKGRCTMNLEKVEAKKGKKVADEYREDKQARAMAEGNWNEAIKKAVRETQEADAALKEIFIADPKEPERGLPNGFNGAIGDEAVKKSAKRAAETYKDIRDGKNPSPEELREAGILARGLDDDPVFSRTLINSIGGPDGLIKTHNRLDDLAYADDTGRKKTFLSLDKGLAVNLASATKEPNTAFYKEFQAKMRDVGLKKYDMKLVAKDPGDAPGPGPVRGYQSLVSLMQRGDDDYGKQFLTDTADSIRVAEDEDQNGDPDVWDLQGNFDGKKYAHFANDPYDGILDVMSRQPDVATKYLDPGEPGEKGKNDNLAYLLNGRDWKTVDGGPVSPDGSDPDNETDRSREGFGRALEAASTGEQPRGDAKEPARLHATHTRAEARVMEEVIKQLAPGPNGEPVHDALRRPVANALADYAPDTHSSLHVADRTRDDLGVHGSESDARISIRADKLVQVMRGVSESPEAFATLYEAERGQGLQDLSNLPEGLGPESSEVKEAMKRAGAGLGAMEAIRSDFELDQGEDEMSKLDWKAKIAYHIVGGAVTPLGGGLGDPMQRLVDTMTWDKYNQDKSDVATATDQKLIEQWLSSDSQIRRLVDKWADHAGLDENDSAITVLKADSALDARDKAHHEVMKLLGRGEG